MAKKKQTEKEIIENTLEGTYYEKGQVMDYEINRTFYNKEKNRDEIDSGWVTLKIRNRDFKIKFGRVDGVEGCQTQILEKDEKLKTYHDEGVSPYEIRQLVEPFQNRAE